MVRFADDPAIRHRIVFLPDYDIGMARYLYWGCDVWLNNPLRPLEACGTSGMKAALNGGLNLSIRDGWWDEWFDGQNGWAIPTADGVDDPTGATRSRRGALYDLLEHQVAPRFYDRDADGVPARWVEMVRHTLRETGPKVQATRMVRDYVQQPVRPGRAARPGPWPPTATARRARRPAWRAHLLHNWPTVRVAHVEATGAGDTPEIGVDARPAGRGGAAGARPGATSQVQAAYGRVDDADGLHEVTTVPMAHEHDRGVAALVHRDRPAGAHGRLRLHRARAPALGAHGRSGGARGGDERVIRSRPS